MQKTLLKYFTVYIVSSLKFIGGIIVGVAEDLSILEVATFTFLGAMSMVFFITVLGNKYRSLFASFLHRVRHFFYLIFFKIASFLRFKQFRDLDWKEHSKEKLKRRKFSKSIRIAIKTWNKFGIFGIAILTPLILSPIGGALLAVSFRVGTRKTLYYMALSHIVFSLLFAYVFIEFKELMENILGIRLRNGH